jgi:hypothetical protein
VPVEGELSAVKVSREEAVPPTGTVTGLGRFMVIPEGTTPDQAGVKSTVELNPLTDVSMIVVDCEKPGLRLIVAGEGVVPKSGAATSWLALEGVMVN